MSNGGEGPILPCGPSPSATRTLELEARRAANIRRNEELLRALGLKPQQQQPKPLAVPEQQRQPSKKRKRASPVRRRSGRIRGERAQNPVGIVSEEEKDEDGDGEEGGSSAAAKLYGASVTLVEISDALGLDHGDAVKTLRGAVGEGKLAHTSGTAWEWALHDKNLVVAVEELQMFASKRVENATARSTHTRSHGATAVTARLVNAARDADWLEHYKHCHHRCSYMTDKALARRVNAIAKAQGRNCVTKLDVFHQVLTDMGKDDIAASCAEELSRVRDATEA